MLGCLVGYGQVVYKVIRVNSRTRTWQLQSWEGATREVEDDDPKLMGLCLPSRDWLPVPVPKAHQTKGPIKCLVKTFSVYPITLTPYVDWFVLNPRGPHLVVYLKPGLISALEPLLLTFSSGKTIKLTAGVQFGPPKQVERPTVVKRRKE